MFREKTGEELHVFSSHKHSERDELNGILEILSDTGLILYLDWQDKEMPTETSGETARKLKEKIKAKDKFILLATESKKSRSIHPTRKIKNRAILCHCWCFKLSEPSGIILYITN